MTEIDRVTDRALLDDDERALLERSAASPPEGFAERVLAARRATPVHPRRRRHGWAAGAVACALVGLVAFRIGRERPEAADRAAATSIPLPGAVVVAARTTTAIGARAVAVVEPGAALRWTAAAAAAWVDQSRGEVFYRVEPGGSFVVRTPAGEVSVEGTCFRVAVTEAAAGREASLRVTVHEGSVSVSGPRGARRLTAGEHLVTHAASSPETSLGVRSEAVRTELARLRARVAELEAEAAGTGPRPGPSTQDPETVQIDRSELIAMAEECRIAWDILPFERRSDLIGPMQARLLGVAEAERARLEQRLRALQQRALDEVRRLHGEVTGDPAEQLSWEALLSEIDHKSPERVIQEALRRISAERAGLAMPPADLAGLPPAERMYRLLVALGDEIEREVAVVLGPQRARALRVVEGGWGSRHQVTRGCPR